MLVTPSVQRVDASAGFDARTVRNELIRAIDVTPVQLPSMSGQPTYLPRAVDVGKTVAALEGLTAAQVSEVRQSYWDHEGRRLDDDLFGPAKGGTKLTPPERARISALLKGTAADNDTKQLTGAAAGLLTSLGAPPAYAITAAANFGQAAAAASEQAADSARREAQAAELRSLLIDDPNERERERIMALLRNQPDQNGQIAGHYRRLFAADLYADLRKYLSEKDAVRAERLVVGDPVGADAAAVEQRQQAIAELNKSIEQQTRMIEHAKQMPFSGSGMSEQVRGVLEAKRREQVAGLQAVLDRTRAEAAEQADPRSAATAGAQRVRDVLNRPTRSGSGSVGAAVADSLLGTEQAVVAAMGTDSAPELAAARLIQALGTDALTPALVEGELRGLRQQAAADVRGELLTTLASLAEHLDVTERAVAAQRLQAAMPEATEKRAAQYVKQLRDSYSARDPFKGRFGNSFDTMIANRGTSAGKLGALVAGHGALGTGTEEHVAELVFALQGTNKDIATVKRVLAGKPRKDIDEITAGFKNKTTLDLKEVLFGRKLTDAETAAGKAAFASGRAATAMALVATAKGKATGYDRFAIAEMLAVPADTEGDEHAEFLARGAREEASWAVDDAGTMGKLHDWGGSETRHLMDETADTAMVDLRIYRSLLAAGKKDEAARVLVDLRKDRARMRVDRAAYSEAVDKFRADFASALSLAVDIAIMVALPQAAPFLLGVAASAAGHIAVNVIAYGDKYDDAMLRRDLLSAIGSAGASKIAGSMLAGRAAGAGVKAVNGLVDDLAITASKTIATEAGALASPSLLALAKQQATKLAKEGIENVAGDLGGQILSEGKVDPSLAGAGKGVLIGRIGQGLRKVRGTGGTAVDDQAAGRPGTGTGTETGAGQDAATQHPSTTNEQSGGQRSPQDFLVPLPALETATKTETTRTETTRTGTTGTAADDVHTRPTRKFEAVGDPTATGRTTAQESTGEKNATRRSPGSDGGFEDTPTGEFRRPGPPMQAADPTSESEAWKLLSKALADHPQHEAGMMWSTRLRQWAVVPGARTVTDFHEAAKQLGWPPEDIVVGGHSHPVDPETGLTPDRDVLASGRGGDVSGIANDAARQGPDRAKAIEAIWVVVERVAPDGRGTVKVRDRTFVVYDRKSGMWTIDFPLPGPKAGRDRVSFVTIEQYHRWYRNRFGSDPGAALPVRGGRAAVDDSVKENLKRLGEAYKAAPNMFPKGKGGLAKRLQSDDPVEREKAVQELAQLEAAVAHVTGRGDQADYDQQPEHQKPAGWIDFTAENARNAILADRKRLKQLNEGALAGLQDSAFEVSDKLEKLNSDVEHEDRKVATITASLPDGTTRTFRFSVAWNRLTGQFGDIHESSGRRGQR